MLLLDVGCGPGNSALQFLELRSDLRIIGIDFSGEILRLAQRTASRLSDGVDRLTWTQAHVTRLPLPDSSLDATTGHSVYDMLEDREAFLREALRVLRPGGRIILLDPLARPYPIGLLRGLSINKIAKFDKALAPGWGVDIIFCSTRRQDNCKHRSVTPSAESCCLLTQIALSQGKNRK